MFPCTKYLTNKTIFLRCYASPLLFFLAQNEASPISASRLAKGATVGASAFSPPVLVHLTVPSTPLKQKHLLACHPKKTKQNVWKLMTSGRFVSIFLINHLHFGYEFVPRSFELSSKILKSQGLHPPNSPYYNRIIETCLWHTLHLT